jgi:hypothetical protein
VILNNSSPRDSSTYHSIIEFLLCLKECCPNHKAAIQYFFSTSSPLTWNVKLRLLFCILQFAPVSSISLLNNSFPLQRDEEESLMEKLEMSSLLEGILTDLQSTLVKEELDSSLSQVSNHQDLKSSSKAIQLMLCSVTLEQHLYRLSHVPSKFLDVSCIQQLHSILTLLTRICGSIPGISLNPVFFREKNLFFLKY